MSRIVTASADYRKGVLTIMGRTAFDVALAKKIHDGPCQVKVTQRGREKSSKQRGYLWAVVYQYLAEFFVDISVDAVHEEMKRRFNPVMVPLPNGETMTVGGSTEEFDSGDYGRYTDKIRDWAALPIAEGGLALYIPAPKEG